MDRVMDGVKKNRGSHRAARAAHQHGCSHNEHAVGKIADSKKPNCEKKPPKHRWNRLLPRPRRDLLPALMAARLVYRKQEARASQNARNRGNKKKRLQA